MIRFLLTAALLSILTATAGAADTSLTKAERIAAALGVETTLKNAQASSAEATRQQMTAMLGELKKQGLPEEYVNKLAASADRMVMQAVQSWDTHEAARIYSTGLVDSLSEKELAEAEAYYKSAKGQKSHAAVSASEKQMFAYINAKMTESMQAGMAAFMEDARKAASESQQATKD